MALDSRCSMDASNPVRSTISGLRRAVSFVIRGILDVIEHATLSRARDWSVVYLARDAIGSRRRAISPSGRQS
jgi:hypothetical protein